MTGLLTPDTEKQITQKMHDWGYESPDAVVLEAMRTHEKQVQLEVLRQEIQKGVDSGESTPLDVEAIKLINLHFVKERKARCHRTLSRI